MTEAEWQELDLREDPFLDKGAAGILVLGFDLVSLPFGVVGSLLADR